MVKLPVWPRPALGTLGDVLVAGLPASRPRRNLLARSMGLPPVRNEVTVERNIPVMMPDGVSLYTDHYAPRAAGAYPTILVRTPYGRGSDVGFPMGTLASFIARRFAERGYHVVLQTTRGRFDSEGVFEAFAHEREDGMATLDWITRRPWCNGAVGTWGPSYLGFTQWALAADEPAALKAMVPAIIGDEFASILRPQGSVALDMLLRWSYLTDLSQAHSTQGRSRLRDLELIRPGGMAAKLAPAFMHLPLGGADRVALGHADPFYQRVVTGEPDDAYWAAIRPAVSNVTAAVHQISGWYDFMLPNLLENHTRLVEAGKAPYLTVGPWAHTSPGQIGDSIQEGLVWFDAQLKGETAKLRSLPVRYYVMGAEEWCETDAWPIAAVEGHYYLHAGGLLAPAAPEGTGTPDTYRYDPADPTPSVAGAMFLPPSGPVDNRGLEARSDVLVYTTPPLTVPVEVVGAVRLDLYVRSSLAHTDFFGRLCDVHPNGRSINICDSLRRIDPDNGAAQPQPDGTLKVGIELWPTAYRFLPGHRIRLQVSSGSHPRWSRNLGTGEPAATGTHMTPADQTVYHDDAHPSALMLSLTV